MFKILAGISKRQLIALGAFILCFFLLMDLNNRVAEYFRVKSQRDRLGTQVIQLQLTKQVMVTQLAYATSDAAVEEWARESGYMLRPGDVRVVPLAGVEVTPTPTPVPKSTPYVVERWQVWWELFFGD